MERTNAGAAPADASASAFSAATAAGAAATVGADSGADRPTAAAARVQQPKPVQQQQPKQTVSNQQPYQDLLQTPAHTNTTQPRTQAAAPVTRVEEAPKTTAEKKDDRSWMIQCGSFKGAEQAETVRAQLAFEGFASHITTNNGWNRVVIGPLKGKESANEMITRLKMAGHANCIRLAARG
ncbi:cell division protein FtsN [Klebsiella pneumoniae]|nr:cell division protein FtsN [Klebsiella pneumoniae]